MVDWYDCLYSVSLNTISYGNCNANAWVLPQRFLKIKYNQYIPRKRELLDDFSKRTTFVSFNMLPCAHFISCFLEFLNFCYIFNAVCKVVSSFYPVVCLVLVCFWLLTPLLMCLRNHFDATLGRIQGKVMQNWVSFFWENPQSMQFHSLGVARFCHKLNFEGNFRLYFPRICRLCYRLYAESARNY